METRLIAFYLPQFHPIPENDAWWGEGFTEWTNVVRAEPLFEGHNMPRLPADLGFYDLRSPEAREMQAALARDYGISAFCYYHYWFNGRRLLERPFQEVLDSGTPDLPFCLCWANEPWSRRWDGSSREILMAQAYSPQDDLNHIRWLLAPLSDPRAVRIDGRPVFVVYRANDLPDPARTTDLWRTEVSAAGLEGIYLIAVESAGDVGWDATQVGFDAKVRFQPDWSALHGVPRMAAEPETLRVYDYRSAWPVLAHAAPVSYPRFETVFPTWDNVARVGANGTAFHHCTPEDYEAWLAHAIERVAGDPPDRRVVFVNAWNEWAEGCFLEPDLTGGLAYLEATRRALTGGRASALTSGLPR